MEKSGRNGRATVFQDYNGNTIASVDEGIGRI